MWRLSLVAMVLAAGTALAEDRAALMARAPEIALDGPVSPLAGPVQLGGAGWGPFRRLCVARAVLGDGGRETPAAPPSCLVVEEARAEGAVWHLALRTDPVGGRPRVQFTTTRDGRGDVGPVTIAVPDGVAAPPPAMMERLRAIFRAAIAAHGVERVEVAAGGRFLMPLPLGEVTPDLRVEGGGFACVAEGEARVGGRRVVVAACGAPARGEVSPGRAMTLEVAGRFAIDVETGLVLRHGYASFIVMEADPNGSMGRMDMRGASRQSLE